VGIAQSKVQWPKRSQKHAIAIDLGGAEIWLGRKLVNGGWCRRFEAPEAFAASSYQELQIDKRHQKSLILSVPLLFPKFVSVVQRGFTNFGNGALTCQGFHHFDRLFALPRLHDWASVAPPRQPIFQDKDFP
jgi:hypothetical protein